MPEPDAGTRATRRGLTKREITLVVDEFVGDEGGQWGGLSHARLTQFFEDLEIDPTVVQWEGQGHSKRQRMRETLEVAGPEDQLRILEALVARYTPSDPNPNAFPVVPPPPSREAARVRVGALLDRLRGNEANLPAPTPSHSAQVRAALSEARTLLGHHGATAALDRAHTALHAYLQHVCDNAGIAYEQEADIRRLYRLLRDNHPALHPPADLAPIVGRMMQNFAGALDPLNQLRNDWSRAHPGEELPSRFAETALDVVSTIFKDVERALAQVGGSDRA